MNKLQKSTLSIFLLSLGVFTVFLNSWNSEYFGLQLATVVGLVENKTFALSDQVYPGFNLVEGDETFRYRGRVYPMKQPGQSVLGAMIYYPLEKLGIGVDHHIDYVVHIITFLTSSMMGAGIVTLLYLASYKLTKSHKFSVLAGIAGGIGSILLPYAGVMHHDVYASFLVFLSVYLLVTGDRSKGKILASGILGTLALFFSMLPVTIPVVLALIVYSERKRVNLKYFLLGMLLGLLPSLIFNYLVFGGVLMFPNLAGEVADTIPLYSLANLLEHLEFFLFSKYSITVYSPVILLGLWGARYIENNSLLKKIVIVLPIALLLHISTQETFGGYQYGPRYLLPALSVLALGIPYYLERYQRGTGRVIFCALLTYSIIVAIIGAMTTVMYPVPGEFGVIMQGEKLLSGELPEYRMLPLGLLIITSTLALRRLLPPRT